MAKQSDTFNFDVLADFLVGPADGKSRLRDDNTDNFQDIDPDDLSKKLSGDQHDDDDDKKDKDNRIPKKNVIKCNSNCQTCKTKGKVCWDLKKLGKDVVLHVH